MDRRAPVLKSSHYPLSCSQHSSFLLFPLVTSHAQCCTTSNPLSRPSRHSAATSPIISSTGGTEKAISMVMRPPILRFAPTLLRPSGNMTPLPLSPASGVQHSLTVAGRAPPILKRISKSHFIFQLARQVLFRWVVSQARKKPKKTTRPH